jgi:glycosyltransferase involved in cell wall biosynthesis
MPVLTILHLLSNRWWTGAAEPALALVQGLLERGHRVVLGVPSGSQVENLARKAAVPLIEGLHLDPHFHPWGWLQDLRRLHTFLRRVTIDVLHTHLSHEHWLAASALAALHQTRPRTTIHVRTVHTLHRGVPRTDRWLLQHGADHLVTVSTVLQGDLTEACRIPAARVTVIPGAVDTRRFHPQAKGDRIRVEFGVSPQTPLVGIVARIAPSRGHLALLEAFAQVHTAIPEARLLIVGKGEFRPDVEQQVRALGLTDAVIFTGYREEDLPEILAALHVFVVLTPGSEGSCRAALEAMSAGKAVVAAPVGALADLVLDGETGLLVDPLSPTALAHAISRLLRAPDHAEQMGLRGRQRIERCFSRERQVKDVLCLYEALLASRAQASRLRSR